MLAAAANIHSHWAAQDPRFAEVVLQRFHAWAIFQAYSQADAPSGDPLDLLPEALHPHIRAEVAAHVVAAAPVPLPDLESLATQVKSALERRDEVRETTRKAPKFLEIVDHWPADREQDGSIDALIYRGPSRRALAQDPQRDLQLCIVEAVGRNPAGRQWLEGYANHSDALIRWTVERILASQDAKLKSAER